MFWSSFVLLLRGSSGNSCSFKDGRRTASVFGHKETERLPLSSWQDTLTERQHLKAILFSHARPDKTVVINLRRVRFKSAFDGDSAGMVGSKVCVFWAAPSAITIVSSIISASRFLQRFPMWSTLPCTEWDKVPAHQQVDNSTVAWRVETHFARRYLAQICPGCAVTGAKEGYRFIMSL